MNTTLGVLLATRPEDLSSDPARRSVVWPGLCAFRISSASYGNFDEINHTAVIHYDYNMYGFLLFFYGEPARHRRAYLPDFGSRTRLISLYYFLRPLDRPT